MIRSIFRALVAAAAFSASLGAQVVYNTSLQNVNGQFGTSTAVTTTTSSGTHTVVTGPGPNSGANRAQGTPVFNSWYQANVGAGSTVGITTDYARSGNGSAYFSQIQSQTGKADLVYNFGSGGMLAPVVLASLTSVSFDFFRDMASSTDPNFAPVFRFDMLKDGVFAGSLVLENVYQNQMSAPVGSWTTLSSTLSSGIWWATNPLLGPTFANANGGQKTLGQWITDNSGSTLSVYGMEIGFGSGWNGTFYAGVDNVDVNFTRGPSMNTNFEVVGVTATPEPASLALVGTGLLSFAGFIRRRRQQVT